MYFLPSVGRIAVGSYVFPGAIALAGFEVPAVRRSPQPVVEVLKVATDRVHRVGPLAGSVPTHESERRPWPTLEPGS